jgi:hypothetical protein
MSEPRLCKRAEAQAAREASPTQPSNRPEIVALRKDEIRSVVKPARLHNTREVSDGGDGDKRTRNSCRLC